MIADTTSGASCSPQPNVRSLYPHQLGFPFWIMVAATGVLSGGAAGVLMLLLHEVQRLAWDKHAPETFLRAVQAATTTHRLIDLFVAGVVVASLRWGFRRATGGHAAEMTAAIWFGTGVLPFWRTVVEALASVLIVGLGASLGREGAPKQMGAAFGSLLGRWSQVSPSHCRILAALGAGAGIAAVYNVPLGGALFALEVLLGSLSLKLIPAALLSSGLATGVAWFFLPDSPTYHIVRCRTTLPLIVCALLIGPAAGIVAAYYVRLVAWSDAQKPKRLPALLSAPVITFTGLGVMALSLPQLLGNGRNVVQLALGGHLSLILLVALLVFKPLATCACLGSGGPGGLFTPTLTLGATLGGVFAQLLGYAHSGPEGGALALIGGAAILAAATQGPVSAIVLSSELIRSPDLLVPVILAVAGAAAIAPLIDGRSIYSGRIHAGRHVIDGSEGATESLSAAARYAELLQFLLQHGANAQSVRVLDEKGAWKGILDVTRVKNPRPSDGPVETATASDFLQKE